MTSQGDNAASGSAGRALSVLNAILNWGPVEPDELTRHTGLNRTAVHRAIHVLIDQGFVRYQLGKRRVVITTECRDRFQGGQYTPEGVEIVSSIVGQVIKARRVQCDIAILTEDGGFDIVEMTDASHTTEREPFFESDLVSATLSLFTPIEVAKITAAILRGRGGQGDVQAEFLDRYRQAQYQGYLWQAELREFCVPLTKIGPNALAIRLWSRENTMRNIRSHVALVEKMRRQAPELFPDLETMGD